MKGPVFFEIPIYRCDLESHSMYMESEEQKFIPIENKDKYPESYNNGYWYFHAEKWYCWKYNEIVGYLNLYIMGSQLRADVWFIDRQRINKGLIKKKFRPFGKSFEQQIPRNKSSAEIFKFIVDTLEAHNKSAYKRHHFDLSTFRTTGEFVNWSDLITKLNPYQ